MGKMPVIPFDVDAKENQALQDDKKVYHLTRTTNRTKKDIFPINNPNGTRTIVIQETTTDEFDYVPDLTTATGVKEFFKHINDGCFNPPNDIDYIRQIISESESEQIYYRQIFISLARASQKKYGKNIDPIVKTALLNYFSNKIEIQKIKMGFVELMHHFVNSGLIENPNIITKLREYLFSQSLRTTMAANGGTCRPDDLLKAISDHLKSISKQITKLAEAHKPGNVRSITRDDRNGYIDIYEILTKAGVFEFQPRLLLEIAHDWNPNIFPITCNDDSLVKAMIEFANSTIMPPDEFYTAVKYIASRTLNSKNVYDAYDLLVSGLTKQIVEETNLLILLVRNSGNAVLIESLNNLGIGNNVLSIIRN